MPEAHAILWFMGAFLGLWSISLVFRGLAGERSTSARACPACRAPLPGAALLCPSCGYEARSEQQARARRRDWRLTAAGAGALVLSGAALYGGAILYEWTRDDPDYVPVFTLSGSVALALLAFGLSLAGWALIGDRSRGRRRCPRCWYDMRGIAGLRCPECGQQARHSRDLYRARRRWKWAAGAMVLLLLAALTVEWPRYQRGGITALVPTCLLIPGIGILPDRLILDDPSASEDWSLAGRLQENSAWAWQERWAKSRAAAVLSSGRSIAAMKQASSLVDQWRPEFNRPITVAIARAICLGDAREKDAAVELLQQTWALAGEERLDLGPELPRWVPGLRAALEHPENSVSLMAASFLSHDPLEAGYAAGVLLARARAQTGIRRLSIALTIRELLESTHGAAAREPLESMLDSPDPAWRRFAILALTLRARIEPDLRDRVRAMLADADHGVAYSAGRALSSAEQTHADVAAVFQQVVGRPDDPDCGDFLHTLDGSSPGVRAHLPTLAGFLLGGGHDTRLAAARALSGAAFSGSDVMFAVPALLRMYASADPEEAEAGAEAVRAWLGSLQPPQQ
jgi:hypothetical protein